MRISEMLNAIASWLESPDNEAVLLAEYDEECLGIVAKSCVEAAALLKITANTVEDIEPPPETSITPQSIDELAQIATAFDSSDDEGLQKQAAVIDELLLTIASPPAAYAARKDLEDQRIEELKKKYEGVGKQLAKDNNIATSEKAIEKSNIVKKKQILGEPLSSRYCPDHPGTQIARIGEHRWQCELDKKIYDYETGFTKEDGTKVPGGDVSEQTKGMNLPGYTIFDTREGRLGS